jgi:phosphoribosylanthranilate isomerase
VTKIKICGITSLDDAKFAVSQSVDFLGFIFYPPSQRYIKPEIAKVVVTNLRHEFDSQVPQFVGVFVDASIDTIVQVKQEVGLDLIQLHGSESPEMILSLGPSAYKALRPKSLTDLQKLVTSYSATVTENTLMPQFLIDTYHPIEKGGTGQFGNLVLAQSIAKEYRLLVAGGLTPLNVGGVITTVNPWGVDVSSGVECIENGKVIKGIKDHTRIEKFCSIVRARK